MGCAFTFGELGSDLLVLASGVGGAAVAPEAELFPV